MPQGRSDVLVVGAGPAGSAAAIAAARVGARVCVVDRARFPRAKTCGDAISNTALGIVSELIGKEHLSGAPRAIVRGAVAVFPDGHRVRRSYGENPGAIVERTVFDELLRRGAERAGADVHEGVTVRALIKRGGRVVGAEGPGFRWEADTVIVADGTASLAWNALGVAPPTDTAIGVSMTGYYEGVAPSEEPAFSEHYFEKSLPTGYGWIFPPVDERANVGVYLRVDRYHAQKVSLRRLFDGFIARNSPRFDGATRVGSLRSWSLPLATAMALPPFPGLLVCGDAARLIDPLTGEGIWHALYSGRLAGRIARETASLRFRRVLNRRVLWPTAARRALEQATTLIVDYELYRSRSVRRFLEWGYNRKSLEVSKTMRES
jgi:geranylgeranyl reductase family protein